MNYESIKHLCRIGYIYTKILINDENAVNQLNKKVLNVFMQEAAMEFLRTKDIQHQIIILKALNLVCRIYNTEIRNMDFIE